MAPFEEIRQALDGRLSSIHVSALDLQSLGDSQFSGPPNSTTTGRKLASLKAEIGILSRMIDSAKAEGERVQAIHNRFINQQSPIHKLPDDMMTMIFEEGNPRSVSASLPYSLRLSGVCHYWRTIALRSPMLWRHLRVQRPGDYKISRLDCFCAHIERSKASTLDMEVHITGDVANVKHIMGIVGPHLARCYRLAFVLEQTWLAALIIPLNFAVPVLKHLSLRSTLVQGSSAHGTLFRFPPPELISLEIEGETAPVARVLPSPQRFHAIQSIKYLSLKLVPWHEVLPFLAECSSLQTLRWRDNEAEEPFLPDPSNPDTMSVITLPNLVHLDVEGFNPINAFNSLVTPALRQLSINEGRSFVAVTGIFALRPSLINPIPSILSLAISSEHNLLEGESWSVFAAKHPQLETLAFDCQDNNALDDPINIMWMLALCSPPNDSAQMDTTSDGVFPNPASCPNLRVLALLNLHPRGVGFDRTLLNALQACLEVRTWRPGHEFQVRVTNPIGTRLDKLQSLASQYPRNLILEKVDMTIRGCEKSSRLDFSGYDRPQLQ